MLNYAQKALRKAMQELDENHSKQDAWDIISEKAQLITLTLTSGELSLTVQLKGDALDEALDLANDILNIEAQELRAKELSWCREITLLDKQDRAKAEIIEDQRYQ